MQQEYAPTGRSSYPGSKNDLYSSSPLLQNKSSFHQPNQLASPSQASFNKQYYQAEANNPLGMALKNPRRSNFHHQSMADTGRKPTITHMDKNKLPWLNMTNDFGGNRGSQSYVNTMNSYDGTSRRNYEGPQNYNNQIPIRPFFGEDSHPSSLHQSPLLRAGNHLMNPYSPSGNMYNSRYYSQEPRSRGFNNKAADVLMGSLQKQNLILAELTSNFSVNKDLKVLQEARELENKIRLLEGSLPPLVRQNQLSPSYQSELEWYASRLNNPLLQPPRQDFSSPLQLMQLHSMMNEFNMPSFGGLPSLPMIPNQQFMLQQMNLYKLQERRRRKDRAQKKKTL